MENEYYLPAEWEPQSGIQLTWPHEGTDWKPYIDDITKTFNELVEAIASHEKLVIVTPDVCPTNDTWARDHGAITLTDGRGHFRLMDFKFNGWGKKFPSDKDNAITSHLYEKDVFNGELVDNNDFVLEGGSIECDGNGTILTTSFCLLAPNRNQPLTKVDIEQTLCKRLNAKRIIWINHGRLIGDDTDGHIDTIVRFAPDNTLLYVGCDDKSDPQYNDFQLLEGELKTLRTLDGSPYKLLKLPMPEPIYDGSDRLPTTYANFLIINGVVIVPTYKQPNLDEQAKAVIGKAFPGRKIIGIDACTIIRQHGSIHCLTMQYPEGVIK